MKALSPSQAEEKAARSLKAKANREAGEAGQRIVAAVLRNLGVARVEPVHTPWRLKRRGGRIVGATPMAKVEGDLRGIIPPTGRSVLVEVKSRVSDDPARPQAVVWSWGDLEEHQHEALAGHAKAGGLALVGLVWPGGVAVVVYGDAIDYGWRKGKPLTVDLVEALALRALPRGG